MSPFQALYGRPPPHLVHFNEEIVVDSLDQLLSERDAILDGLQFNLARAQQLLKYYADKKRIGKVAYTLELPDCTLIHPTFHVSQLKVAVGSTTASPIPPHLTPNFELVAQPDDVLNICYRSSSSDQAEILVLWKDLPPNKCHLRGSSTYIVAFSFSSP